MATRNVVRLFDESCVAGQVVLGGKGRGLADMVALGLPVPPGFVITTSVSRALSLEGRFPKRLDWHLRRGIEQLEKQTGKRFGNPENPLLVSVRSGAPVSMPGMMDTILNLGQTDAIAEHLAKRHGDTFAQECRSRFFAMFKTVTQPTDSVRSVPEHPWQQLYMAIEAVCRSWQSPRAVAYRKAHAIPDWLGTAVNVQEMVFGNLDPQSCTGVVFSVNVTTGQPGLYGEFLVQAQGEDVVAGTHTGRPISEMQMWNANLYDQLTQMVQKLARHYGCEVDVEFTVQSGRLYLLQVRPAKLSPLATIVRSVHQVWAHRLTKDEALASLTPADLSGLDCAGFDPVELEQAKNGIIARGLAVSAGAVSGVVALSSTQAVAWSRTMPGVPIVLVRPDTSPEDLEGMLVSKAIVTGNGGATSHAAVVARGMGITAVVGCGEVLAMQDTGYVRINGFLLNEGDTISVDGLNGLVIAGRMESAASADIKEVNILRRWAKQYRPQLLKTPPAINWGAAVGVKYSMNLELVNFYVADAMALAAHGTALAGRASALKHDTHQKTAQMVACYLILAIAGELRHIHDGQVSSYCYTKESNEKIRISLETTFGFTSVATCGMGAASREHAQAFALKTLQNRPLPEVATFVALAEAAFDQFAWSGSYGGEPWAAIAKAVKDFLRGDTNATVFVDHVFDLRHHGGLLFNKHSMTADYTNESNLRRALEVKKSVSGVTPLLEKLLPLSVRISQFDFQKVITGGKSFVGWPFEIGPEVHQVFTEGLEMCLWKPLPAYIPGRWI